MFANLQGYIFPILQYIATKLCNSTNRRTLFLAVIKDLVVCQLLRVILITHLCIVKSTEHVTIR